MLVDFNKTEIESKRVSQYNFLKYMEIELLLCNDIINHFDLEPLNFEFIGLGGGDSEDLEIYQYFLFDIDRLNDLQYLKEPLYYCNELNLGVLGFTNLGTHRSLILTDIPLKKNHNNKYAPVIDRDLVLTNEP